MASRASVLSEYKGLYPLSTMMVNLPCLWGSVSQLPSSHLFIHRVPAKLLNGVMLHGGNPCRLQLLFVPGSSLTYRWNQMVLNMSADASPALSGGSRYRYGAPRSAMGLGPSRTQPCSRTVRRKPGWILDGLLLIIGFYWIGNTIPSESRYCLPRFRTYNVLQHPFGIELDPFLQNHKDDSEEFTGNHNQ